MSLLKIEHLRKEFPDVTPLEDVSFEVNKGDRIGLIGANGVVIAFTVCTCMPFGIGRSSNYCHQTASYQFRFWFNIYEFHVVFLFSTIILL